jgi:hypothetical protein
LLFETESQAFDYAVEWKKLNSMVKRTIFLVQCTIKPIMLVTGVKCKL